MIQPTFRLGFVGAGSLGTTLAVALSRCGYRVVAISSRRDSSAGYLARKIPGCAAYETPQRVADVTDAVFLTTPDDAIEQMAATIRWRPKQAVIHCSGASSLEILKDASIQKASIGSIHPMQTFPHGIFQRHAFRGIFFAIEASIPLLDTLEAMARALGGRPVVLHSSHKALYHASGMMACGFLLALLQQASLIWNALGISQEEGLAALLPIARTTLKLANPKGLGHTLSGPLARGDLGTIRLHLDSLHKYAPEVLPIYCAMAISTLPLAQEKGHAHPSQLQAIRLMLQKTLDHYNAGAAPSAQELE